MFKNILSVLFLFLTSSCAFALGVSGKIDTILDSFNFEGDSVVSIMITDKDGKTVYSRKPNKLLNPASVTKLFTMAAAYDTLGEDFEFKTAFYKDEKNNYYLKLSGDPMLTSEDVDKLAKSFKKGLKGPIKQIYIDDNVIDMIPYPQGWTSDDMWPNFPKLSPYMIDSNTVYVDFLYSSNNTLRIIQKNAYKFSFTDKLEKPAENNIKISLDDLHNTVNLEGGINSSILNKKIPVLNPRYFFCSKLTKALNDNGINYTKTFLFKKTPDNAIPVAFFNRDLSEVIEHILKESDNLGAEMVFKVAGGKYKEKQTGKFHTGSTEYGIEMFKNYMDKIGADYSKINIRDGSGVSRYNVMSTGWINSALAKMDFDCKKFLPTSTEGTLSKRMRNLKDLAYFKTGTLYGTSSIAGILDTRKNQYIIAMIMTGYNRKSSQLKGVEDEIIYEIYRTDEDEN